MTIFAPNRRIGDHMCMKFTFENVGAIESAEIDLKGLTIITGLNDIGKSVISKSIFSVIKTVFRANELAVEERNSALANTLQQISSIYRTLMKPSSPAANNDLIAFTNDFATKINQFTRANTSQSVTEAKRILGEYRSAVNANLAELLKSNSGFQQQFDRLFDVAADVIKDETVNEEKYKLFFDEVIIKSIFQNQFNAKMDLFEEEPPAKITVTEGDTTLVQLEVRDETSQYFKVYSEPLFNEATLLESPYIVQLNDFTNVALAYLPQPVKNIRQSNLPYHVRDLSLKLRAGFAYLDLDINEAISKIESEIGGSVYYDPEDSTVVFENGQHKIKSFNIASGIKSFGMLQMILNSGLATPRALLIIDEPEVHLHMKWQLVYAEVVALLVQSGISILISTHSPFFLEALSVFVKKYSLTEKVTIYNGSRNEDGRTKFDIVPNDNLEVIFKHLTEPMINLQILD